MKNKSWYIFINIKYKIHITQIILFCDITNFQHIIPIDMYKLHIVQYTIFVYFVNKQYRVFQLRFSKNNVRRR